MSGRAGRAGAQQKVKDLTVPDTPFRRLFKNFNLRLIGHNAIIAAQRSGNFHQVPGDRLSYRGGLPSPMEDKEPISSRTIAR